MSSASVNQVENTPQLLELIPNQVHYHSVILSFRPSDLATGFKSYASKAANLFPVSRYIHDYVNGHRIRNKNIKNNPGPEFLKVSIVCAPCLIRTSANSR